VRSGLAPEKSQQRTALFAQPTEPLSLSTGVFSRNDPHVAGQRLAIREPLGNSYQKQLYVAAHTRVALEKLCFSELAVLHTRLYIRVRCIDEAA
jgi:hypothetical protein